MSIKLKALGLGLIAALAVGAFGVVNATANPEGDTGGHFVSDAPSEETTIIGTEGGEHNLHFKVHGINLDEEIGCDIAEYHGTMPTNTETNLVITPKWDECYTTPDGTKFNIHENGCTLDFTVNTEPEVKHSTVHVGCPTEKNIEITHPNCNITVPPQTVDGVAYDTIEVEEKHAITLTSTIKPESTGGTGAITTYFHSFGCILVFGTHQEGELLGSATVEGFDHESGERVNITAT